MLDRTTSAPEVFVSYAREDSAYRDELLRAMWEWGIPAWSDQDIQRGSRFPQQLRERVESAAGFIVLMSPDSHSSSWVAHELEIAIEANVPIFPLLLRGQPLGRVARDFHYDQVHARKKQLPPEKWFRQLARSAGTSRERLRATPGSGGAAAFSERLYGRATDVRSLRDALVDSSVSAMIVSGFAGVGKTALVLQALSAVGDHIQGHAWLDAGEAGSLEAIARLLESAETALPDRESGAWGVVVLDGVASNLLRQPQRWTGFRDELGSGPARIKLIVTSRGTPSSPPSNAGYWNHVLQSISREDSFGLLAGSGVSATETATALYAHVGGNPSLLLRGCEHARAGRPADRIVELISASVREWIGAEVVRLRPDEQACVEMVALSCEPVSQEELSAALARCDPPVEVGGAIDALQRGGWLTRGPTGASATPVISAAVAFQTITRMAEEMALGRYDLIGSRRLLSATAIDSVQRRQRSQHLSPLLSELRRRGRTPRACLDEALLSDDLGPLAVGNLLNLVGAAGDVLAGADLAGRYVAEADLRSLHLTNISFRGGEFDRVRLRLHVEGITSIAVDDDWSAVVAGAADGRLHVFSPSSGAVTATVAAHDDVVTAMTFNSDGTLLATSSDDEKIRLWDARDWALVRTLSADRGTTAVAVDTRGRLIAAGGYSGEVRIWNRYSGDAEWSGTFAEHISLLAFAPDGRTVAIGFRSGTADVWDFSEDRRILRTEPLGGSISSLAFEESGHIVWVSSSDGRATTRWDVDQGTELARPSAPLDSLGVTLSGEASLAAASIDQSTIGVWDTTTGDRVLRSEPDDLRFQALALNPRHRRIVAGGDSQAIRCWDLDSGDELWTVRGHSSWVKSTQFAMDDSVVACCADDERIHLWDKDRAEPIETLSGHGGHIRAIAKDKRRSDRLYSASDDRTAAVWNLPEGRLEGRFEPHDAQVWAVASSTSGDLVATGTLGGTITIWSAVTRDELCTFTAHDGPVRSLSFDSPARRLATGGDDGLVKVWKVSVLGDDVEPEYSLVGHNKTVWCVAFGSNPRLPLVASASVDATVRVWHLRKGREVAVMRGHVGPVWTTVVSRRGKLVLSGGSDHTVRAWHLPWHIRRGFGHRTLRPAPSQAEHEDWVRSIDLSADEDLVLTGSHDGSVGLWDSDLNRVDRFPILRPYEDVNLIGVSGLSVAELESLAELGALTKEAQPDPSG